MDTTISGSNEPGPGIRGRLSASLSRLGIRPGGVSTDELADELADVLSLTMQAIQTASALRPVPDVPRGQLEEVAAGRPYELSSGHGSGGSSGVVSASVPYFFHTGFGPGQSIRIDLGRARRVRRIEISNRRGGHQDRARHLFAVLSGPHGPDRVFPMYKTGALPDGSWREIAIDVPDVKARYLTVISPVDTALHFSGLRVFALPAQQKKPAAAAPAAGVALPPSTGIDVVKACAARHIPIKGLIHVGANDASEYPYYAAKTRGPLLYVEAIPEIAETTRQRLDPGRPHYIRQAAVAETSGETVTFHISSNEGMSSSLLELGAHAELYPDVTFTDAIEVVTERLDDIVAERPEAAAYNVLVLDVQGAELKVLQGAPELLKQIDAVVSEISPEPLYEGGCTFLEVTNLLAEAGLVFRDAAMRPLGWGDALYTRSPQKQS